MVSNASPELHEARLLCNKRQAASFPIVERGCKRDFLQCGVAHNRPGRIKKHHIESQAGSEEVIFPENAGLSDIRSSISFYLLLVIEGERGSGVQFTDTASLILKGMDPHFPFSRVG